MTERALPTVGTGTRRRAATGAAEGAANPARPAVARPAARQDAILSTPARAGMLLGASAAVYAVSLAAVSGLQAETDSARVTAAAPYQAIVEQARAANDDLERRLLKTDSQVRALVGLYGSVGGDVEAYQARLDELAALVADVQGSAAALPARIKLPTVSTRGAVSRSGGGGGRSAPAASGSSGASGG